MLVMILGLALWWGAHLFKFLAPEARRSMGGAGQAVVAAVVLGAIALMTIGFRSAEFIEVWTPPRAMTHINNLLMLLGFYLFAAGPLRAKLGVKLKNPMLSGFKAWAVGHLLVNGDLASIILFGGLLAWAVVMVIVKKRLGGPRVPKVWGGPKAEVLTLVATLVALGVVGAIHTHLGYWPFG